MDINQIHALNFAFAETERKLTDHITRLMEREQSALEQQQAMHEQLEQLEREKTELAYNHGEQERALLREHAERLQALSLRLHSAQEELNNLQQDRVTREHVLSDQTSRAQQKLEQLLCTLAQREQDVAAQLLAGKEQLWQLEQAHAAREQQLQAQLVQTEQQTRQEIEAQLRSAKQREQEFTAQLLAAKDRLLLLGEEYGRQEKKLLEQLSQAEQQARQESEAHLRNALEREQAQAVQQLALQQQAAQALAQQARELQLQHDERRQSWEAQEKSLRQEVSNLVSERQTIRHASELQTQKYGFVMEAHLGEHQRLIEAYAVLEARFKAEIAAEKEASLQLHQVLAEVQQALAETYASLSWRLTAPLRAVLLWFAPTKPVTPNIPAAAEGIAAPSAAALPALDCPSAIISNLSVEPIMPRISAPYMGEPVAAAPTLDALLACHDQSFVVCAYRSLLGRAPDAEGLRYYLSRLRTGVSKIQLLAQLRSSKEGKAYAAEFPGLNAAIQRYQRGRYPVIGWLLRLYDGTEGNRPSERKLRGIENQIFLLSNESNRRFDQLETALAGLRELVVQQTRPMLGRSAADRSMAVPENFPEVVSVEAPNVLVDLTSTRSSLALNKFKRISPRAQEIYFQLRAIVGCAERTE